MIINDHRGTSGFTRLAAVLDNVEYGRPVFGYPLNHESYIKIVNSNVTYYLYRYDTKKNNCTLNQEYMAQRCIG
ncbi:MAG: hypothetical protein RQ885_06450 [Desulfurococcales archaeon]|nr:hypothetical protein [Desulfurococcales archaeon]